MMILGLDPSSTRTGYAVVLFGGATKVIDAGYLRGRTKDEAKTRIMAMRLSLLELLQEHLPTMTVVEIPSGKIGGGQRRGASASSMAIYGLAAGVVLGVCLSSPGTEVVAVDERVWTSRVPKSIRQRRVAAEFPAYRDVMKSDGGGDIADAIGLALWGLGRKSLMTSSGSSPEPHPQRPRRRIGRGLCGKGSNMALSKSVCRAEKRRNDGEV